MAGYRDTLPELSPSHVAVLMPHPLKILIVEDEALLPWSWKASSKRRAMSWSAGRCRPRPPRTGRSEPTPTWRFSIGSLRTDHWPGRGALHPGRPHPPSARPRPPTQRVSREDLVGGGRRERQSSHQPRAHGLGPEVPAGRRAGAAASLAHAAFAATGATHEVAVGPIEPLRSATTPLPASFGRPLRSTHPARREFGPAAACERGRGE